MLGIDHQHGRFRGDQPATDPDDLGWEPGSAIQRAETGGNLWLGGVDTGPAPVRQLGSLRQRAAPAIPGTDDRVEPGADGAADHQLPGDRPSAGGQLSAHEVRNAIYHSRPRLTGLCGQGTRKSEWAGDQANPRTRVCRLWPGGLPEVSQISVAQLYRLRNSAAYRQRNTTYHPTRPAVVRIGERRKPVPNGSPGYLRIDTVHQGDQDGRKGIYHVNAVDQVTQWEIVAALPKISELWLIPVLEAILAQFPFVIRGFHSDNGSEFINHTVAKLLGKLLVEQTKSRAGHSGDNGLVEAKNGAIIRKHIGFGHIGDQHAAAVDEFHRQYLNPYLNFHRPCAVPLILTEPNGKRRRTYRRWATPFELFQEVPQCEKHLRAGVTLISLEEFAGLQSDTEAALDMQRAKRRLQKSITEASA